MRDIFGREFHPYHELFLFLGGEAFFITEQKRIKLTPHTLIVIPQNTFHCFTVEGDEADYERVVFNFYSENGLGTLFPLALEGVRVIDFPSADMLRAFLAPDGDKYTPTQKKALVQAKLTEILVELCHVLPPQKRPQSEISPLTASCLEYIQKHIQSKISAEVLSAQLNYSMSSITHTFKAELNISLYKYIIEKKLICAHIDIQSGMPAAAVCEKYAFSDYSCFYRHYKKRFGVAPTKNSRQWV